MTVKAVCEKVESVDRGLKLTVYITDEAQMDEAFRLRKKEVSLSLGHGDMVEDGANKEFVRTMAMTALQETLDSMFEKRAEEQKEEQLLLLQKND